MMCNVPHTEPVVDTKMSTCKDLDTNERLQVRFRDEIEVHSIPSAAELTPEDKGVLYCRDFEFRQLGQTAIKDALDSRRQGCANLLNETFGGSPVDNQLYLNQWTLLSRRGLERMANSRHGHRRKSEQKKVIHSILRAQEALRSFEGDSDILAELSRELSKNSTDFAMKMGKADAHAAQHVLMSQHGLELRHPQNDKKLSCASDGVRGKHQAGRAMFLSKLRFHACNWV